MPRLESENLELVQCEGGPRQAGPQPTRRPRSPIRPAQTIAPHEETSVDAQGQRFPRDRRRTLGCGPLRMM
jgi:hypothetical protein